jgi:P-type E1-E2 ATPase
MSEPPMRVGMVGDGANDLIAIKEADLGIGLSDSDGAYGAAFSVPSLSHVVHLLR